MPSVREVTRSKDSSLEAAVALAKLTSKGQATIPKEIRDYLDLKPGDRILFVQQDGEVILRPVTRTLLEMRGTIQPRHTPEDFDKVRKAVKRKVGSRLAQG